MQEPATPHGIHIIVVCVSNYFSFGNQAHRLPQESGLLLVTDGTIVCYCESSFFRSAVGVKHMKRMNDD